MSPFLAFIYALLGVACAYGLWRRADKQRHKLNVAAWISYLVWYVSVGMGASFTLLNLEGKHQQAAMIGAIGTAIVAISLGLVVFRLASPKKVRSN